MNNWKFFRARFCMFSGRREKCIQKRRVALCI